MCTSREYPYLSQGRDFSSETTSPLLKFHIHVHVVISFGLTEPHQPPGNSHPVCAGSMDIFWNCTIEAKQYRIFVLDSKVNHQSLLC